MAQDDTPTAGTGGTTAALNTPAADDPIGLIDDNIVRRLVRVAVHVRGYAPYYAATIAFGVMLLVVPGLGGSNANPGPVAAGVTRGTEPPASTSSNAAPSSPAAPAELASADDFFAPSVTTEAASSTSAPSYSFDDFDYEGDSDGGGDAGSPAADQPDDTQKPCYVAPPPGAPVSPVSPDREVRNYQNTAEAAVGQEGPGEASEPVRAIEEAAGQCDDGTGAQSAPEVPSAPVSTDAAELDDVDRVDNDAVVHLVGNMFFF